MRRLWDQSSRLKRMPELHATIARAVAMQPCPLRGQDIRFLRKQLGYSAKEWATFLRTDASTPSRWENDQQEIGTQSDTLIRLLYFRIRDEKEGSLTKESVATAAAAVNRACLLNLCVNMENRMFIPTNHAHGALVKAHRHEIVVRAPRTARGSSTMALCSTAS